MMSYLLGCIAFNFVAVVAYALVNYGMTTEAKLKAHADIPAATGTCYNSDDLRDRQRKADCHKKFTRMLAQLVWLDWHMRWIFPLAFLIYNVVMFSIVDNFDPETKDK